MPAIRFSSTRPSDLAGGEGADEARASESCFSFGATSHLNSGNFSRALFTLVTYAWWCLVWWMFIVVASMWGCNALRRESSTEAHTGSIGHE